MMHESPDTLQSPMSAPEREPRWWRISIIALVASAYLFRFVQTQQDPDLWGHVRFGLDALRTGSIARTDPYSYLTAGLPWINHEVIAELAMGLAYSLLGPLGLNLLRMTLGLTTLAVIWTALRRRGVTLLVTAALTVVAMFAISLHLIEMRPHLFTLLFFTLTIVILQTAEQRGPRVLWFLVPTFWLWINSHGGVLAGLGIAGLWTVIRLLQIGFQRGISPQERLHKCLWHIAPLLAGLAVTLITPYGPGLLAFLLRTAVGPRPEIADWQPLPLASGFGVAYVLCLGITLPGLLFSRRRRSVPSMIIYAVMALAPFLAVRHLTLFGSAAALIAGEHINDIWVRWRGAHSVRPGQTSRLFQYLVIGSTAGFAIAVIVLSIGKITFIPVDATYYPIRAVKLIRQNVPEGNLAIHYNWGEYAIWHLGPAVKVSMDGRRETVYSEELYQMNLRFMTGRRDWDTLLDKYSTDMALVDVRDAPYNLMQCKPGWVMVYEDDIAALFVREDFPYRQALEQAAPAVAIEEDDLRFP